MSLVPNSVKSNLLAAFRYLLKPLVRLAVKNSVTFPDFSDALRKAYVDVAVRQLAASNMEVTEEGISLIANIEKSEVRDVLGVGDDTTYARKVLEVSPLSIILSAWHTDPKYTGPYGVLRDIEFSNEEASKQTHTFTALASSYCPQVSPRALMDELIRIGAVQDVGNGYYRAVKRSYVPEPLSTQSILMLASAVHHLCETLENNLRTEPVGGKGLIQRSIYTVHGIPKSDHRSFDKFIRERGQAFADDVDNWITARDVEGIKDSMQMGVGFYHYIVNEDDERILSKELPKK